MPLKQNIYFSKENNLNFLSKIRKLMEGSGCKNEAFKFVGIHLDENLTWNHHVKAVKKASSAVFALSNVRNLLPSNIKHTIYNSLFRSFVEYEISAWGRNESPEMKKLA